MSYNNVKISIMTIEDFYNIENILIDEFDDFWNAETLKTDIISENSQYVVARDEDEIVGFAGIKIVYDEADIMNIVTKKNRRNSGIGNAMLGRLIDIAIQKSVKKITLEVNSRNLSAIHLYEKNGFKQISIRKKYYGNIDDALIMQINL